MTEASPFPIQGHRTPPAAHLLLSWKPFSINAHPHAPWSPPVLFQVHPPHRQFVFLLPPSRYTIPSRCFNLTPGRLLKLEMNLEEGSTNICSIPSVTLLSRKRPRVNMPKDNLRLSSPSIWASRTSSRSAALSSQLPQKGGCGR